MKIVSIFLFAFLATSFAHSVTYDEVDGISNFGVSDKIRLALENLKEQLRCGFPEQGIPPLAPFEHEYEELNVKEDFLTLFASIANLRVEGADNYEIGKCDFSLITWKFKLDIKFNKLHINRGKYLLKTLIAEEIAGIEFHGDGDIDFAVENLSGNLELQLGLGLKGLYLKNFNLILKLDNCKSQITGLTGGGLPNKVINIVVEKLCVDIVQEHQREISQNIHDIIVPIANKHLNSITLKDLLGWITGWSRQKAMCYRK